MLQRLFLIGYRGTGKTTVAELVARHLAWSWSDADAHLERRHGRSIRAIFADEGEASFRDKESAVLSELAHLEKHVIATGGGVVLRAENRAVLQTGKSVWLTAAPETLWKRMQADATTSGRRPDLAQGGLAEVRELLAARAPLYAACADRVVDTADKSPHEVAEAICRWLEK